jgi:hypothetical protein
LWLVDKLLDRPYGNGGSVPERNRPPVPEHLAGCVLTPFKITHKFLKNYLKIFRENGRSFKNNVEQ